MNKVILIGRLTNDPELSFIQGSGSAKTTFTIAINREYKNKDGEKEADFINCIAWNKRAETMANNLTKGRLVAIWGSIRTSKYQKDGQTKYSTAVEVDEFQFLDPPKNSNENYKDRKETGGDTKHDKNGDPGYGQPSGFYSTEEDDDIPF